MMDEILQNLMERHNFKSIKVKKEGREAIGPLHSPVDGSKFQRKESSRTGRSIANQTKRLGKVEQDPAQFQVAT
ncbi:unnamed protein product [Dovyalis caffra]|uniref:Uncharacterized protein n=1 Tax=Dovyalis caffra TaxID=77055 RepID=A0AAV1SE48_9ROSI|nr:unnamed protein product [Dovyalis caffra]